MFLSHTLHSQFGEQNEDLRRLFFSVMILYYQAFKMQIWGISVKLMWLWALAAMYNLNKM